MAAKKGGRKAAKKTAKRRNGNSPNLTHAQIAKVSHDQIVRQIEELTFWVQMLKIKVNWGRFSRRRAIKAVGRPTGAGGPPTFP